MAAATTICYGPSSIVLGSNLLKRRHLKNTSFADRFSPSRSLLCSGFVPRKPALGRNSFWVSKIMDESVGTSAFRDAKGDETIQVFEQEAFIDGSSPFRFKFLSPEVEYKLNRLSKWIVTALFGSFILWRHDAEALWFTAGSVLNAMLSVLLKRILNQERPSTLKSDPGMPSSHAQSIFFTVFFVILSGVEWLGLNGFTIAISGLVLTFGSFLSYLRVVQQLHTVSQVVVGAAIGSISSILWYWLWNGYMMDAFVSSLWVRIIVVLGSAGLCIGFVLFVIRHWLQDD
ncbi:lipid phosphate phosphatase epsilon 1, chloroplastic-like [Glycine soja]|uniref:Lipid phosphate phosphatase epsilon 2, chloroplastic isoform A n=1 Tax=Glycine soja TaxID=3848 RepID=A0A445M4E0_GLYSO|nr:lipid phosphate phosphatase epsilon 1, chloroplastic-like [Glycine soja]KHN36083.1 Dolichyldiphosphatase [Glycine soja]RZC30418.1 Lipid phosphate phosphatase epsilon 2, chloroplastic isoform A [Glycine soja]